MKRASVLLLALSLPGMAQAACRQALALGLDMSGSVDASEYRMQLDGVATALNSPPVQEVLFAPAAAPVRIMVYEWSGPQNQTIVVPWTTLQGSADLAAVTARLHGHQRGPAAPTTAIGSALIFGLDMLARQPDCWQQTLDLSGDGENNTGPRPQDIAAGQMPLGAVVNGLVVDAGPQFDALAGLAEYYGSYVVRGPDAFVEKAYGFADYAAAMERKLLRELASIAIGQLGDARETN